MSFSVKIKASAAKSLRTLPRAERERLAAAIDRLSDEPNAGGALKGEFFGLRRLRDHGPSRRETCWPGKGNGAAAAATS